MFQFIRKWLWQRKCPHYGRATTFHAIGLYDKLLRGEITREEFARTPVPPTETECLNCGMKWFH